VGSLKVDPAVEDALEDRDRLRQDLADALAEIDRLQTENEYLRREIERLRGIESLSNTGPSGGEQVPGAEGGSDGDVTEDDSEGSDPGR
jgi:hypothetical protein